MLWFITGGYLVKRWFIPAAARARGQSNDLNRGILASNLFNCHSEVNAPPITSISRCIHIVYWHKNVWEYQWSNFIFNCMSTFLHYVHCKDALLDCSAPGGERCESLTWVDEIEGLAIWDISFQNDSYTEISRNLAQDLCTRFTVCFFVFVVNRKRSILSIVCSLYFINTWSVVWLLQVQWIITRPCAYSGNTWLCVHWQWNTREWCH